jgi:hypothetical protein
MVNCFFTLYTNQFANERQVFYEKLQVPSPQDQDNSRTRVRGATATATAAAATTSGATTNARSITTSRNNQEINALAKIFYGHHLERITSLVNESSAMLWHPNHKKFSFGPFLNEFPDLYRGEDLHAGLKYICWPSLCQAAKAFDNYHQTQTPSLQPLPHALFLRLHENWGALSSAIPNRTAFWMPQQSLENHWKQEGCSPKEILAYLDHPDTRAVVTTQFQAYDHPKVHSLPLGVDSLYKLKTILGVLKEQQGKLHPLHPEKQDNAIIAETKANLTRPQLLMVNCKRRSMREATLDTVIQNFHGTVQNTYPTKDARPKNYPDFAAEMHISKFILSPGGLGLDCYRHWEALMMGTIPVIEHLNRTDGWYRSLSDLPVAWIDSYDNLTPQFLEQEYARILQHAEAFNYEKLTKQWWIQMIQNQVL